MPLPQYSTFVNILMDAIKDEPPKLGLTGYEGDSGDYTVQVEDDPTLIYVRIQDGNIQTPVEAINLGIPIQPDYPVIVYYKNKQAYAVPDQERSADYRSGNDGLGTVAPHSHEPGLGLFDVVSTRRLREAQVTVTLPYSMSVTVAPFKYWNASGEERYFTEGAIDLTDFVPSTASQHCLVKVYFDLVTETLGAVAGTATSTVMLLTEQDLTAIQIEDTQIPLAGVRLTNGMTEINDEALIIEWRFLFGSATSGLGVIDSILTDDNGDVLSDDNGDVLTED